MVLEERTRRATLNCNRAAAFRLQMADVRKIAFIACLGTGHAGTVQAIRFWQNTALEECQDGSHCKLET
jgi:hypothetical protein